MNTQHTPTPVAKGCPLCGSANVTCQAGARWNTTTQDWVLADMLLVGICPACNWTGSVNELRERPLMSHEARTCNVHDELTDAQHQQAMRVALDIRDSLAASLRKLLHNIVHDDESEQTKAEFDSMIAEAEAALAKAGAL